MPRRSHDVVYVTLEEGGPPSGNRKACKKRGIGSVTTQILPVPKRSWYRLVALDIICEFSVNLVTRSNAATRGTPGLLACHSADVVGALARLACGRPGGVRGNLIRARFLGVGALGRTAPAKRRRDPVGHPPRGHQEAGVADHPMVGADRQSFDVPGADEGLEGVRLGEGSVPAQFLDDARHLGGGGDVSTDQSARDEGLGDRVDALPGGEHVEDDAVHLGFGDGVLQRSDGQPPRRVRPSEDPFNVGLGDLGEVGATFVGGHGSVLAHRA
jgi:hypothetical protein